SLSEWICRLMSNRLDHGDSTSPCRSSQRLTLMQSVRLPGNWRRLWHERTRNIAPPHSAKLSVEGACFSTPIAMPMRRPPSHLMRFVHVPVLRSRLRPVGLHSAQSHLV